MYRVFSQNINRREVCRIKILQTVQSFTISYRQLHKGHLTSVQYFHGLTEHQAINKFNELKNKHSGAIQHD